jgi:hypothetical protein
LHAAETCPSSVGTLSANGIVRAGTALHTIFSLFNEAVSFDEELR